MATTATSLVRHINRLSIASLSPFSEFALRFLRTMILSRLLSPGDLGAAVVLMSILTGCEMITDVGLDKFVMVSVGDERAQVVAAARQISISRAIILAAAIAIFAPYLAGVFDATEHYRIIAWLGVVPLIRSFKNWRIIQVQQDYRYGAEIVSNVGGHAAAVIAVIPAFIFFHDERVMLASLVAEAAVSVVLSYMLVRPQGVSHVDPVIRRAALAFGLPLMANGLGLVILKQLDQVIVANLFGLQTLALYSLVLNLAILPTSVMQRIAGKLSLPFLGKARDDNATASQASLIVIVGMTLAAAAFAIPIGLTLDGLAPLVYGPQYKVSVAFSALAMLAAFLRFARGGPNMVLLDHGQTGRMTAGNMIAIIGMLLGFALGVALRSLEAVLLGVVVGDLLSFLLLLFLMNRIVPAFEVLRHIALISLGVAAAAAAMWLTGGGGWAVRAVIFVASMFVIGCGAILIYQQIISPFARNQNQAKGQPETLGGHAVQPSSAGGIVR